MDRVIRNDMISESSRITMIKLAFGVMNMKIEDIRSDVEGQLKSLMSDFGNKSALDLVKVFLEKHLRARDMGDYVERDDYQSSLESRDLSS